MATLENDPVNFRDPSGFCQLTNWKFWGGETLTLMQTGIADCFREWEALAALLGESASQGQGDAQGGDGWTDDLWAGREQYRVAMWYAGIHDGTEVVMNDCMTPGLRK